MSVLSKSASFCYVGPSGSDTMSRIHAFQFVMTSLQVNYGKIHLDDNAVFTFLVVTFVNLIYRIECKKDEHTAHSTV